MAQPGLDEADVGAAFEHASRHGVAEQVAGAAFADLAGVHVSFVNDRFSVRSDNRLTCLTVRIVVT